MSQQFKFNILTGDNAQSKYDAITTKEPFTFYLLQTGVGYLGEKKLFDAASVGNTEVTLTGKFFRAVASHVITQADLDNANLSKPDGTAVGDAGILFTSDNNNTDDGDELQYFVPVKIPATTSEIDGTNPGNDIPTATAVVNYINQVLGNYVTFEVDGVAGTPAADGSMIFPGAYSNDEVRIGTWVDGKPLYRKVFTLVFTENMTTWKDEPETFIVPGSENLNVNEAVKISALRYEYFWVSNSEYDTTQCTAYTAPADTTQNEFSCSFANPRINSSSGQQALCVYAHNMYCGMFKALIIFEYTKTTDNGGT